MFNVFCSRQVGRQQASSGGEGVPNAGRAGMCTFSRFYHHGMVTYLCSFFVCFPVVFVPSDLGSVARLLSASGWHKNGTVVKKLSLCVCVCVCVCQNEKESARRMASTNKRKSQAQWKEKYRTGRGPILSVESLSSWQEKKRERLSTKSTHVTIYLFRDLNRDRSRLLWMTVGPKGQYSAKRKTRKRQLSKMFKRWSNLHRRRPLAVLRTSGVIVHLAPGASRRALGYVRSNFWHTHSGDEKKEKKNQSSKKEGRKIIIREKKCDPPVQISVSMR